MSDNPAELVQAAAIKIITALFVLTPDERVEALQTVGRTYCRDCGYPTPPDGPCHCANDE